MDAITTPDVEDLVVNMAVAAYEMTSEDRPGTRHVIMALRHRLLLRAVGVDVVWRGASVAEPVYATDLKSVAQQGLRVRIPPEVPILDE